MHTRDSRKAAYARRIASGLARGLTRSQARGHARSGETAAKPKATFRRGDDPRFEAALKALHRTGNQAAAAKEGQISPERFRRLLGETGVAEFRGRRWHIRDTHPRDFLATVNGERTWLTLPGFEPASLVGRHEEAVKAFLESNDPTHLAPFAGRSVTDVAGKSHLLETRPNVLHRLANDGTAVPEIYRFANVGGK